MDLKREKRRNLLRNVLSIATLGIPVGAIGMFSDKGRPVFVFPKRGETKSQAAARVAQAHGKAPSEVRIFGRKKTKAKRAN